MLAQLVIFWCCLPSGIRASVAARVMWVPLVVHLEVKRVLQVIAWLLSSQTRHHGRSVGDLRNHKIIRFGQRVSDFADLRGSRHAVRGAPVYPAATRYSKFPRPTVRSSVRMTGRGSS
jgi:hypothetical protein